MNYDNSSFLTYFEDAVVKPFFLFVDDTNYNQFETKQMTSTILFNKITTTTTTTTIIISISFIRIYASCRNLLFSLLFVCVFVIAPFSHYLFYFCCTLHTSYTLMVILMKIHIICMVES